MLVFRKVQEALGFTKCSYTVVGAAPVHRETLEFFMGFDIPILEMYGMTESTGPHTMNVKSPQITSLNSASKWRVGSCGKNMSGAETKIDNPDENGDGEVSNFW